MKKTVGYILLAIVLAAVAMVSRLVPHPANFTALGAVALFSGTYLPRRWGWWLPLGILFVTDAAIGFYNPLVMLGVYGSFAVVSLIGWYVRRHKKPSAVLVGALSASIIFFVITNFAVWAFTAMYPKTGAGLFAAYAMAVPFFRNMLLSDVIYTGVLFGAHELGMWVWRERLFWTKTRQSEI